MLSNISNFFDVMNLSQEESMDLLIEESDVQAKEKLLSLYSTLTSLSRILHGIDVSECPHKFFADLPSMTISRSLEFPLDWVVFRASGLDTNVWQKSLSRYLEVYGRIKELEPLSPHQLIKEAYQTTLQHEGFIPLIDSFKTVLYHSCRAFLLETGRMLKLPTIDKIQRQAQVPLKDVVLAFKLFSYAKMFLPRYQVDVFKLGAKIVIGRFNAENTEIISKMLLKKGFGKIWILAPLGSREIIALFVIPPSKNKSSFIGEDDSSDEIALVKDWNSFQGIQFDIVEEIHYWVDLESLIYPNMDQELDSENSRKKYVYFPASSMTTTYEWMMRDSRSEDTNRYQEVFQSKNISNLLIRLQSHVPIEDADDSTIGNFHWNELLHPVVDVNLVEPRMNVFLEFSDVSQKELTDLLKMKSFRSIFPSGYAIKTRKGRWSYFTSMYQRHFLRARKFIGEMRLEKVFFKVFRRNLLTDNFF